MSLKVKITILFLLLLPVYGLPVCFIFLWLASAVMSDISFTEFLASNDKPIQYYTIIVLGLSLVFSLKMATKTVIIYLNRKMEFSFEDIGRLVGQDVLDFSGCQKKAK